ncbi:MAG: AMP-binding protein [Gemmatimonadetes bacterium]|nr:AMP-binding protein [Gemmatimonadota bacterium]NNF11821.1 AMP-binding protein [Gemmatimonadota bacterium]
MALTERVEGMTIASALTTRATTDPGSSLLLFGETPSTLAEINQQADALAASLANLGVESGDRIALILPPCPEFVVGFFAAAKLGAVVVPLNPRLTSAEIHYMLRHSEAVCAVTVEQDRELDYLQLFEELMPQLPELQYLVTVGEEDLWYDDRIFQFEDLISAGGGRDYPAPTVESDDFFALVYTSGTSGKPKGVELSHANLLAAAGGAAEAIGLGPGDRVVGISALFHVYGLASGLLGCMLTGAAMILQDDEDAAATLDAVERQRATVHFGIPTLFVSELDLLDERSWNLDSLRLAVIAGAPVRDELVASVAERLGVTVVTGYSLTETASTVSASRPDDPPEKRRFTVGRPIEGTTVRIVDAESPAIELPVESVGEIRVKGPGVMLGYYRQPRQTSEAFDAGGFFRTGDLGLVDEEGYLHLVGRTKDVIIRSGFNVYPREVEARIESHPAVQEAAAVGIPDALLGEAICACVVPVEGAIVTGQEIVEWCRETLADDKTPDRVRFFDALPRSDTGQVRRVELSRAVQSEGQPT